MRGYKTAGKCAQKNFSVKKTFSTVSKLIVGLGSLCFWAMDLVTTAKFDMKKTFNKH